MIYQMDWWERPFEEKEIRKAIGHFGSDKTLGLDIFLEIFYNIF